MSAFVALSVDVVMFAMLAGLVVGLLIVAAVVLFWMRRLVAH